MESNSIFPKRANNHLKQIFVEKKSYFPFYSFDNNRFKVIDLGGLKLDPSLKKNHIQIQALSKRENLNSNKYPDPVGSETLFPILLLVFALAISVKPEFTFKNLCILDSGAKKSRILA